MRLIRVFNLLRRLGVGRCEAFKMARLIAGGACIPPTQREQ
jgi:hypothetical protein